jgi:hypothetical protein
MRPRVRRRARRLRQLRCGPLRTKNVRERPRGRLVRGVARRSLVFGQVFPGPAL